MLTDLETARQPFSRALSRAPLQLSGRPVLLATDGSPASNAAARVALALAKQHHAEMHVVSVMDTRPMPAPPPLDLAVAIADATIGAEVHAEQIEAVRAKLNTVVGEVVPWNVRMVARHAGPRHRAGGASASLGAHRHRAAAPRHGWTARCRTRRPSR